MRVEGTNSIEDLDFRNGCFLQIIKREDRDCNKLGLAVAGRGNIEQRSPGFISNSFFPFSDLCLFSNAHLIC